MFNILVMTEEKILSSPPLTTPLLFENLVGGSNPPQKGGGGAHYAPYSFKINQMNLNMEHLIEALKSIGGYYLLLILFVIMKMIQVICYNKNRNFLFMFYNLIRFM